MKNFLVPTDFSVESHNAYEVALQLAKRTGGKVTLLHTLELPGAAASSFSTYGSPVGSSELPNSSMGGMDAVFTAKLLQVTRQRLQALIAEGATLAPGVEVFEIMKADSLTSAATHLIKEQGFDLVVMGAQGHGASDHFFYGSNTERMVRLATCPVLSVKHPNAHFEVKNIVFASDFAAEADKAAPELGRLLELFPEAKLHLLHVNTGSSNPALADQLTAYAQRHRLPRTQPAIAEAGSVSKGIIGFVGETRPDLVVLPTHHRTGLGRYLQASIAEKVATQAFPPVLTFHL